MRPYLAVIADSFRSAFASRVLWLALLAIYLFLAAIAPIGYHEVFTTSFRWPDFANGTRMKAMLARAIDEPVGPDVLETPAGRIARYLPDELQRNLRQVAAGQEVRIRLDILADGLNSLLDSDLWYDPTVWASAPRLRELRELEQLGEEELHDDLRRRLGRLRIEAALPGVFESRGSRSIALTYAGMPFPTIFQVEKSQFQMVLNHFVLRVIIDWVLGFIMIFLGILVTAAIIPDMLQPGSLHLLLSKPVSRPLLFLAKFVGGCAFVFVCVSQLILGLWLIAGLRLDVWNVRLLLCIPVCVFLFSVFYSVSAVAGLKWRSPILAIGLANLFGAGCLLIGFAATLSDSFIVERDRITGLTTTGETVLASTRGGHLRRFDRSNGRWVDLFPDDTGGSDRVIPPVTLSGGHVVTARVRGGRINLFGSGATPLLVIREGVDGPPEPSIELPAGTRELIPGRDGELLALNTGELLVANRSQWDGGSAENSDEPKRDEAPAQSAGAGFGDWLPKLVKMMGGASDGFQSVLPPRTSLLSPNSVALDPAGDRVFVFSGGKLLRLDRKPAGPDGTRFDLTAQSEVQTNGKTARLRLLGETVVIFREDESPLFLNDLFEPIEVDPDVTAAIAELSIATAVACPGAFGDAAVIAIQTRNGQAWLLGDDGGLSLDRIRRVSAVEAMHWDRTTGRLWLAHQVDRLSAWQLSADAAAGSDSADALSRLAAAGPAVVHRPTVSGWRLVERYLVTPLRTVTPQTGELGETIAAIVSGEDSLQMPLAAGDDVAATQRYNIWRPLLTCGGFVAVMLLLGSVYFSRTDF